MGQPALLDCHVEITVHFLIAAQLKLFLNVGNFFSHAPHIELQSSLILGPLEKQYSEIDDSLP